MLLDLQTQFSGATAADGTKTGQSLTATAISTNVLDLRSVGANPTLVDEALTGLPLWFEIMVLTAAAGGDAAKTVTFTLESDSTADLATSATVHWTSTAITGATLIAGYKVVSMQLPSAKTYERYLGVRYTVSAGFTAFQLLAYFTLGKQSAHIYPAGFTIDV